MKRSPRNRKGQFRRRTSLGRIMLTIGILGTIATGIVGESIRTTPDVVEAQEVATSTPDIITEIIDIPETITATEVGFWFMDSDVELMRAYSTSDFDEVDRILMERKAFMSSVVLLSYDKDVAKIDYQDTK